MLIFEARIYRFLLLRLYRLKQPVASAASMYRDTESAEQPSCFANSSLVCGAPSLRM
jgi:hypothetical protein